MRSALRRLRRLGCELPYERDTSGLGAQAEPRVSRIGRSPAAWYWSGTGPPVFSQNSSQDGA